MIQGKQVPQSSLDGDTIRAAKSYAKEGDFDSASVVLAESSAEVLKVSTLGARDQRLIDSILRKAANNAIVSAFRSAEIAADLGDESRALFDIQRVYDATKYLGRALTEVENARIDSIRTTASSRGLEVLVATYEDIAQHGSPNEAEHLFGPLQELSCRCPLSEQQRERLRVAFDKANQRAFELWGTVATGVKFESLKLNSIVVRDAH